jgi:putative glutamine amidotransferase
LLGTQPARLRIARLHRGAGAALVSAPALRYNLAMGFSADPPVVGIPACLVVPDRFAFHQVGDKYVTAVLDGAGALPLLIPALGAQLDPDHLLSRLDGLLITGSPSNVAPQHYGGQAARPDSPGDPARDATTLPLIRRALGAAVPLFAICRGLQELNVALGGSLHQEVHALPGRLDHRSDKTVAQEERYAPAHTVRLSPGGALQALLGGAETIMVNSLHGQAIDRLAPGLAIEALAPDGTIEAVRVVGARGFVVAVQWHPEWRVQDNPVSRRLFAAFGAACRARAAARVQHERHGALASGA